MATDLIFLHGARTPRCIASVDKRFSYHTLQMMTRGGVDLRYDQQAYALRGPWVWPAMPGPHVRFCESPRGRPWSHRYIAFDGPLAAEWSMDNLLPQMPQPMLPGRVSDWARRFDRVIELAVSPTSRWDHRRAVHLLESLLIDLAEVRGVGGDDPPPYLRAVLQEVASPYKPDYAAVAEAHHMSRSTLQRRFREATGVSLHTYRLRALSAEARRLLGDTDLPIKTIADRLGYRDVFYFTRQFTQAVGVAPAAYRRSRQV